MGHPTVYLSSKKVNDNAWGTRRNFPARPCLPSQTPLGGAFWRKKRRWPNHSRAGQYPSNINVQRI